MAGRRRKKRTHIKKEAADAQTLVPKTFVIKTGTSVTKSGHQLVRDLRQIMEPNTASRLQERKHNKLKDYLAVAGQLGVTHFLLLSQTDNTTNLRLAKFPKGPSIYFKIQSYMLAKDVINAQFGRTRAPGIEYQTAPLLVLNNLDTESSAGKLVCAMLQGLFPSISTSKVRLADVRRVVLFNQDTESGLLEVRHYLVTVKTPGISKTIKRLVHSDIPNLGNLTDISDYLLKEAALSDSEAEPDSIVTLAQQYNGPKNPQSSKRAISLSELGPRLSLRLIKILDGFCEGNTIFHVEK